jgi:hypothetical protein
MYCEVVLVEEEAVKYLVPLSSRDKVVVDRKALGPVPEEVPEVADIPPF